MPLHASRSCTKLVSPVIPSKVTSTGDSAFIYCTSLTAIDIPAATISVGSSAFSNCTSLKTIKYGGTMAKARSLFTSTAGVSSGVTVLCADGSYTTT